MSNEEQIEFLETELKRVSLEIQETGREEELKELAKRVTAGDHEVDEYFPDAFQHHPLRAELLCDYYLFLYTAYESIKGEELLQRKKGTQSHQLWLHSPVTTGGLTREETKSFMRQVSTRIAASGVAAGLIWLGKSIIEYWPFGYPNPHDHEQRPPRDG